MPVFLDPVAGGEQRICSHSADYMKISIKIGVGVIEDMKYLCLCDPTANVAIGVLSSILKGKTLDEAGQVKAERILQEVGSDGEELYTKSTALVELIQKGLTRYTEARQQRL